MEQEMGDNLQALHPGNTWHEWDEKAETQDLVDADLCIPGGYHDLMDKCHFGLTFRSSDATYNEWEDARDWLFNLAPESVVSEDTYSSTPIFKLSQQHSFSDLTIQPVDDENHNIYLPGHEKPIEVNRQNLHMQDKTWTLFDAGV